jgi:hypothetical protein
LEFVKEKNFSHLKTAWLFPPSMIE